MCYIMLVQCFELQGRHFTFPLLLLIVTYLYKKQLWLISHLRTIINKHLNKVTYFDHAAISVTDCVLFAMREKKADESTVMTIVASCCSSETVHHVGSSAVSLLIHPEPKLSANKEVTLCTSITILPPPPPPTPFIIASENQQDPPPPPPKKNPTTINQ